jgi:hypothetical protein
VKAWDRIIAGVALVAASTVGAAWAGESSSCHFHGSKPASEATVLGCADKEKMRLIETGKVAPTWKSISHKSIEQVEGKHGKEWKITYADPDNPDKEKANLYMFFSIVGNFIAANFTGK